MIRIAILGEIGSGNLGDDFCYMLLAKALEAECSKRGVMATVEPYTPSRFQTLDNHFFHLVVIGGGTLIDSCKGPYMDRLERRASAGQAYAALGSGVNDQELFPNTSEGRECLAKVKENAKVWITRTQADPIALIGSRLGKGGASKRIGINIGYTAKSRLDMDRVYGYLKNAYDVARIKELDVVFLSAWRVDDKLVQALQYNCYPSEFEYIDGSDKSLKVLSELRNVFCTRVHLGALAACCGALPIQIPIATKATEVILGIKGNCVVPNLFDDPPVTADIGLVGLPRVEEAANVLREGIAKAIGSIL